MSRLKWALMASVLLLLGANQAGAQATIRLGGTGDATVQSLDTDVQADTEEIAWRGGRYYGGGRYHGYGRSYGWRGYAGYRPFYYRPYAYWPYYAYRYYGYGYYAPGNYYPAYYGSSSYYYNVPISGVYANPCVAQVVTPPTTTTLTTSSYSQAPIFPNGLTPERMPPPSSKVKRDDTYRHDRNPAQTMPMPILEKLPAPTIRHKTATVPLEGRLVSLPSPAPRYFYPAHGED